MIVRRTCPTIKFVGGCGFFRLVYHPLAALAQLETFGSGERRDALVSLENIDAEIRLRTLTPTP